jgi:hypothetical protein
MNNVPKIAAEKGIGVKIPRNIRINPVRITDC